MMNFLKQEMCFHYVYGHTYQTGAPALTWGCRCYLDKWQLLFWKTWINLEHKKKCSSILLEIIYGHWREDHALLEYYLSEKNP